VRVKRILWAGLPVTVTVTGSSLDKVGVILTHVAGVVIGTVVERAVDGVDGRQRRRVHMQRPAVRGGGWTGGLSSHQGRVRWGASGGPQDGLQRGRMQGVMRC
jgi:hypothetical protein